MVRTSTRVVVRNGKLFPAAASGAERKDSQTQPLFLPSQQDLAQLKRHAHPASTPRGSNSQGAISSADTEVSAQKTRPEGVKSINPDIKIQK